MVLDDVDGLVAVGRGQQVDTGVLEFPSVCSMSRRMCSSSR
jgi:hypothetical protein